MTLIEQIARHFFGEPNEALSKKNIELRFGTHGSKSVLLAKNSWFDHETNEGGGPFDLIKRETGLSENSDCWAWLEQHGYEANGYNHNRRRIEATYDYTDENRKLLFQVVRYEPKAFSQRKPNGKGDWVWSTKGVRQVPYRLPELLDSIGNDRVVLVPEGEKDVNALWKLGVPATCNAGGSGKFSKRMVSLFNGADIIVLADNDEAGRGHAYDVASKLHGTAHRI